jgi:hypothetical protein
MNFRYPGFDWSSLPEGSLIVDVGGADGTEVFDIAKRAPQVKLMIQDRDQTIQEVTTPVCTLFHSLLRQFWDSLFSSHQTWLSNPDKKRMIDSGQVTIQGKLVLTGCLHLIIPVPAHNFLVAQPSHLVNKPAVFFMRAVTHNWPSSEMINVLKHLHAAAPPPCKLIIADLLVPHACPNPQISEVVVHPMPPVPLLTNLGEANEGLYALDHFMGLLFNGQERTLLEFKEMTEAAGWKIQKVYQAARSPFSQLICKKL